MFIGSDAPISDYGICTRCHDHA